MRATNGQNRAWQTIAMQDRLSPLYHTEKQNNLRQETGPFKLSAGEWRSEFDAQYQSSEGMIFATLSERLLDKIREKHWGQDTYEFRVLVKYVPNVSNTQLKETLPAPASAADGSVFNQWNYKQKRAEQALLMEAANDWWYCFSETIDTEWF